jgi:hypothetical protein
MNKSTLLLCFLLVACASRHETGSLSTGNASTNVSRTTANADAANKPTADKRQQVICTREEQVGSHFARTICRTRAEMEAERRESLEVLEDSRGHDSVGNLSE